MCYTHTHTCRSLTAEKCFKFILILNNIGKKLNLKNINQHFFCISRILFAYLVCCLWNSNRKKTEWHTGTCVCICTKIYHTLSFARIGSLCIRRCTYVPGMLCSSPLRGLQMRDAWNLCRRLFISNQGNKLTKTRQNKAQHNLKGNPSLIYKEQPGGHQKRCQVFHRLLPPMKWNRPASVCETSYMHTRSTVALPLLRWAFGFRCSRVKGHAPYLNPTSPTVPIQEESLDFFANLQREEPNRSQIAPSHHLLPVHRSICSQRRIPGFPFKAPDYLHWVWVWSQLQGQRTCLCSSEPAITVGLVFQMAAATWPLPF